MTETFPLLISGLALFLALAAFPGLGSVRLTACLVALGSGQIYIAVLALLVYLVISNDWRLRLPVSLLAVLTAVVLLVGIATTTLIAPIGLRTYAELAQLALYLVFAVLLLNHFKSGLDIMQFLRCATVASVVVAAAALVSVAFGLQAPPSIFLGRGSNEGAVFLSLTGVVPAAALFVRSRNPLYVAAMLLMMYAENVATSRGALVASALTLLFAFFFVFRNWFIRALLIIAGLVVVAGSVPMLISVYQGNLNFSAKERLALAQYGYWLWEQRPVIGWGWGATTDLAMRAPTTALSYPHFHNTYVQLMVESGAVGIAIIAIYISASLRQIVVCALNIRQPAVTMLAASVFAALTISGFFDAMLYGADRALQVVILLCLSARATALAHAPVVAAPSPEKRLLQLAPTTGL